MAIQSVERALQVFSYFSLARTSLGIGELSELMGLPKGTIHGIVRTMAQNGFLQQDPETRKYRLGLRLFELGAILGNTLEINQKAAEPLYALARRTGLDSRLAIWDGGSVLITMGASVRSQAFLAQIGPRMPAYCSASGKIFLSYMSPQDLKNYLSETKSFRHTPATIATRNQLSQELEQVRRRGYAANREELSRGIIALAAPVFGRTGAVIAAISISLSPDEAQKKEETALADELLQSAMLISRGMGYAPENFGAGRSLPVPGSRSFQKGQGR